MNQDEKTRKPNRLIHERSPYLLQHAYNPVDWYPWGDEAFRKAKEENRPIFLSIGYSTCHWCHVMEEESFEHQEVADLLNNNFIPIKVDREERPDIDAVYMEVCQAMNGRGGWPLTIIMTPEKVPFVAATYIPRESIPGRIGLMDLLTQINGVWTDQPEKVEEQTSMVLSHFSAQATQKPPEKGTINENTLYLAFKHLEDTFDEENGGFGNAPKFPSPHNLLYLLRYWHRSGDEKALDIVERTLKAMRAGGIYDHIGFGFHRYSTDSSWLVPHFEKMLYDQGMLAIAYSEAYQATHKPEYAQTIREIFEYVERDMTSQEGGFYCAEDADSEGIEGKFYVWDVDEIKELLGDPDADIFIDHFNIQENGNFLDESTHQPTGKNILHVRNSVASVEETANKYSITIEELESSIEKSRIKLFDVREKRVHPSKDDKILTDWNGLMIAALAIASRAVGEKRYEETARRCADFILTSTYMKTGSLSHLCNESAESVSASPAFLDDHAFLIWGLIELYESTFETSYLNTALKLNEYLLENYEDVENGGLYQTSADSENLLFRKKEVYDGAMPSGNSVALSNLIRLGRMTGNPELEKKAHEMMESFSGTVSAIPIGYTHFLSGVNFILGSSSEVVIAGEFDSDDNRKMLLALDNEYLPNNVVIFKPAGANGEAITRIAKYTENYSMKEGRATAYVCKDMQCNKPTNDPENMVQLLKSKE
ncbi:thioredoxin domain-containing protein [Methanococcoides sp. LMO-2]|uniref:Thioredoxin domain-containing protein n=1 Tax=Methanococcoides cohabitans TaxID=3136559 RepID=A0ABU9KRZ4_9EURY